MGIKRMAECHPNDDGGGDVGGELKQENFDSKPHKKKNKKMKKESNKMEKKTKRKKKDILDDDKSNEIEEVLVVAQQNSQENCVSTKTATIEKTTKEEQGKQGKATTTTTNATLPFDYKYIVAPMVGASELPFRILCRKYGAQLVYTPMMLASQFATNDEYRKREFQTTSFDRPLVCHFAANSPLDFAKAAKLVEPHCDAIDLNLGCPQRTAYVGHFGSYLLDSKDRKLVLSIVQAGVQAVNIPIFVKIRLLDTFDETVELVDQLYKAGASLIAVHARYRATFHRKGPGARDGPALLDQVQKLKEAFPNKLLVTNGNTITYDDVVKNLDSTKADGIMSAEGILDNPALYLQRLGSRDEIDKVVPVKGGRIIEQLAKREKILKKLNEIKAIEGKNRCLKDNQGQQQRTNPGRCCNLTKKEQKKLTKKKKIASKLEKINKDLDDAADGDGKSTTNKMTTQLPLRTLYDNADNMVLLAFEYLQLAKQYPTILRTIIFHTRRILKVELTTYQLMEECLSCTCIDDIEQIVQKIKYYQSYPMKFQYDIQKAKRERDALERKKIEEGKRKSYEARMIRKAKREGRDDLEFYLRQGAVVPTQEFVESLKTVSKEKQLMLWKEREHSQHCIAFHLLGDCPRGRACAFLHVDIQTKNTFEEQNEVAG